MATPLEIQVTADINGLKQKMGEASASIKQFSTNSSQSIFNLKEKLRELESVAFTDKSKKNVAAYNLQIQQTQKEIKQLSNVGKEGFDQLGNAAGRTGSSLTKAFTGLRSIAYILPGIGIAGIFNLAFEAIGKVVEELGNLNGRLSSTEAVSNAFKETFDDFGKVAQKATVSVNEVRVAFDLAKQGVISKGDALKLYNQQLGETLGKTNDFNEAERLTIEKGEAFIKVTALKAQAMGLFAIAAKQSVDGILAGTKDQTSFLDNAKAGILSFFGAYGKAGETLAISQINGVKKAKQAAIENSTAISQSAEGLLKEAAKISKEFGLNFSLSDADKSKKNIETVEDALKKLRLQIDYLNANEINLKTDETKAKISAIEGTIKELITKFKLKNDNVNVINLYAEIKDLQIRDLIKRGVQGLQSASPVKIPLSIELVPKLIGFQNFLKAQEDLKKQLIKDGEEISGIIKNSISSIASGVGDAIAGGGNFFGGLFSSMFKALGEGLKQLGAYAITTSKIIITLKKTIGSTLGIVGGIALIALGTIISAAASRISAPKFATGVSNFSGGTAIVGERGPELVQLPQGSNVIPNGNLNAMGNGAGAFVATYTIQGTDLVTVINRANRFISRNG